LCVFAWVRRLEFEAQVAMGRREDLLHVTPLYADWILQPVHGSALVHVQLRVQPMTERI
jgi:hypothetical protein